MAGGGGGGVGMEDGIGDGGGGGGGVRQQDAQSVSGRHLGARRREMLRGEAAIVPDDARTLPDGGLPQEGGEAVGAAAHRGEGVVLPNPAAPAVGAEPDRGIGHLASRGKPRWFRTAIG